ncbi:MAG TPA: GNAT family N-acetyltransferase [Bacteroidia bacterium]|nr:GNAT family N-acetyltransferase [Bacteroidia bacterium]
METARLVTRFLTKKDEEIWTRFLKNEDCTRYFPKTDFASPVERARYWIEKQINRYKEEKYGLQALVSKETGAFVGQCGLLLQEVDGKKELEVGYHILREYWGRGYAPEAAQAFIKYGAENSDFDSIISIIHRENKNSIAVALKNGLRKEKETTWFDLPVSIYRINKDDIFF